MEGDTSSFIEDRGEYMIYSDSRLHKDYRPFHFDGAFMFSFTIWNVSLLYLTRLLVINVRSVETFVSIRDF